MFDVLLDTILDVVKLIPFLFVAFLIIELIEHKYQEKSKNIISKSGKYGPVLGGIFGAVPQCGFSALATNLYITRIISLGTLISIYLSTSDEMLPILLSNNVDLKIILSIVGLKVVIGMCFGFIIDLLYRKKQTQNFHICEDDDCDCEESVIKSCIIHTLKTVIFIFVITYGLNLLFYYVDVTKFKFINDSLLTSFITPVIGLIPNCAASIMLTELYLSNIISFGSMMGGLLTGSGVAILILFQQNKNIKENLTILGIIYAIGALIGLLINII